MENSRTIIAQPLTREAFAPYGEVIEKAGRDHFPINNGKCQRFHDLTNIELLGENAKPLINIFEGTAYPLPLKLQLVERHPFGSQAFMPLGGRPYLVIVSKDEAGTPGTPMAFMASGQQGVNYPAGQWHGVLTPIGQNQDFLVVDRGGDGNNLEEYIFDTAWQIKA